MFAQPFPPFHFIERTHTHGQYWRKRWASHRKGRRARKCEDKQKTRKKEKTQWKRLLFTFSFTINLDGVSFLSRKWESESDELPSPLSSVTTQARRVAAKFVRPSPMSWHNKKPTFLESNHHLRMLRILQIKANPKISRRPTKFGYQISKLLIFF